MPAKHQFECLGAFALPTETQTTGAQSGEGSDSELIAAWREKVSTREELNSVFSEYIFFHSKCCLSLVLLKRAICENTLRIVDGQRHPSSWAPPGTNESENPSRFRHCRQCRLEVQRESVGHHFDTLGKHSASTGS